MNEYQVIRSELFHYGPSGQNITLDNLPQHLAMSLQKANREHSTLAGGFTLHVVLGKGDWKFKREWLAQSRHYNNTNEGMCPRCFASGRAGSPRPWLDCLESFNNNTDLQAAKATRVGPDIWHPGCTHLSIPLVVPGFNGKQLILRLAKLTAL